MRKKNIRVGASYTFLYILALDEGVGWQTEFG
jgi:hypothetical protein